MNSNRKSKQNNWIQVLTISMFTPVFVILLFLFYFRPTESSRILQDAVIITGEYPPYSSQFLEDHGVASAIISEVLKGMGYESNFQFTSWNIAQELSLQSNSNQEIRGAFPYAKTDEREKDFYFSDPIFDVETSIFFNSDNTPELDSIESIDKLINYYLIPIEGYSYLPQIDEIPRSLSVASDNVDAFTRLLSDPNIQLVAEATEVGHQLLQTEFPRQQHIIKSFPVFTTSFYLMSSKRNPHNRRFIHEFNRSLREIGADRVEDIKSNTLKKIDEHRSLSLIPIQSDAYIKGYMDKDHQKFVLLPRGTRVIVKEWPHAYLNTSDSVVWDTSKVSENSLAKVKVFNGPLKDETLYVDGRSLEINLNY